MTGSDWMNGLAVLLTAIAALGGGGSLLLTTRTRRKLEVDATQVMAHTAVTLVKPLEERLERAEGRATRAEQRADKAEQRLVVVEQQAYRLGMLVDRWRKAIMDPGATVEWLRDLVSREPTS